MLITTTTSVEGKKVTDYKGIVSAEVIVGANILKDLFAGIRDIVGGRSAAYEEELQKAKQLAFDEITSKAQEMGANAIIAVDLDFETIGQQGSMLMVCATGTAVELS
jgi:uncharacterized protein YbjQ (UPF0145 family)